MCISFFYRDQSTRLYLVLKVVGECVKTSRGHFEIEL